MSDTLEGLKSNIDGLDVNDLLLQFIKYASKDIADGVTESVVESWALMDLDNEDIGTYTDVIKAGTKENLDKIKTSIQTIKDELKMLVTELEANNPTDIAQAIEEAINTKFEALESRAKTIADTSTNAGQNKAKDDSFKRNGFGKQWLSQRDGKVRLSHRTADGQIADKNGNFKIGSDTMKHPNGGTKARENVNCRCKIIAVKQND